MTESDNAKVSVSRMGRVALVTIERPRVLNAMNPQMLEDLIDAVSSLQGTKGVRAIVLTGTGRAFLNGADVAFMQAASASEFRAFVERIQDLTRVIRNSSVPVIAAVNGLAVGAGCEILCACDARLASSDARFGFPESRLAITVTSGASWLLPRLVGRGWARRLLVSGELVSADQAVAIGLVEELLSPDALLDAAVDLGERFANAEAFAVTMARRLLDAADESSLETALRYEVEAILSTMTEGQGREGMLAFLEKREPSYRTAEAP